MGWLTSLGKVAIGGVKSLVSNPIVSAGIGLIPGGTLGKLALTGVVGYAGSKLLGGGGSSSMPALPGMPALPDNSGLYNVTHGPGGSLEMPGFGPNKMAGARTLDDSYLKVAYRAPKGYRVVRDANGKPYAMEKHDAIRAGLSKRHHKPPISVGQWHALKKAKHVVKVLKKCEKEASHLMAFGHRHGSRRAPPNVVMLPAPKRRAA